MSPAAIVADAAIVAGWRLWLSWKWPTLARWRQVCLTVGVALTVVSLTIIGTDLAATPSKHPRALTYWFAGLSVAILIAGFCWWPKPKLRIGEPTIYHHSGRHIAQVRVKNVARTHEDNAVARSIRPIIQFQGATASPRIEGKWSDEWDTVRVPRLEAIPPSDDGYGLDLAFKWPQDKEAYALNGKNFAVGLDSWRLGEHVLPDETYNVIVELTGSGFKKATRTFTLTNSGDSLTLREND